MFGRRQGNTCIGIEKTVEYLLIFRAFVIWSWTNIFCKTQTIKWTFNFDFVYFKFIMQVSWRNGFFFHSHLFLFHYILLMNFRVSSVFKLLSFAQRKFDLLLIFWKLFHKFRKDKNPKVKAKTFKRNGKMTKINVNKTWKTPGISSKIWKFVYL